MEGCKGEHDTEALGAVASDPSLMSEHGDVEPISSSARVGEGLSSNSFTLRRENDEGNQRNLSQEQLDVAPQASLTRDPAEDDVHPNSPAYGLDDNPPASSAHNLVDDVPLTSSTHDVVAPTSSSHGSTYVPQPNTSPGGMGGLATQSGLPDGSTVSNAEIYNMEGESRFGDTNVHTTGPVFNAPIYITFEQHTTVQQTPEQPHCSSTSVVFSPCLEETSPKLPASVAATTLPPATRSSSSYVPTQVHTEPKNFGTTHGTQQNVTTSQSTLPQTAISVKTTPNDKCSQLKVLLKEKVRTNANEESTLAEFLPQPIPPVHLSKVSKPQQVEDEFQMQGHYHRREDLDKMYKRPDSDITSEEMFPSARSRAIHEANRKFGTNETRAKQHYVEKHGNVIAVVGQAGIGKTTSAKQWALQALDRQLFGSVSFIFYIPVRLLNFIAKMTFLQFLVSTMLPEWSCTSDEAKHILSVILDDPCVLLIFDGLDEANFLSFGGVVSPPLVLFESKAENYLKHLAGGNLLPRARKIFTSRPAQLYKLHPAFRPKFIVEILGLTPLSQEVLGQKMCGSKYDEIKRKLTQNSNVFAYCYVPVNYILTLNYLMNYNGDIEFVSLTRVLSFTCGQYAVTDHLKGQECEFDKLSKLAWVGFLNRTVVFYFKDFKNAQINDSTADAFLKVSVVRKVNLKLTILDGHKLRYFSHLIWQEFFAAVYLMMIMPLDEFKLHYTKLAEDRWEVVAKFAFGICDSLVFRELYFLIPNCSRKVWNAKKLLLGEFVGKPMRNESKVEIKRLCSWAYESNDRKLAASVCSTLPTELDLSSSLLPIDVTNLSFVLETENLTMLKKLDLSWNNIGSPGATTIANGIHNLSELELHHCDVCSWGVEQISSKTQALLNPLKKLDLSGNKIGDVGATLLALCIYNIEVLLIYDCDIGFSGQEKITDKILFLRKPITRFDISFNNVGDLGCSLLGGCIANIKELVLKTCQIRANGMDWLSRGVQLLGTPLMHLELSGNKIGDLGATFLASCVHNIRVLILYDCEIGSDGMEKLSEKIKVLHKSMKEFDISMNQIGDKGAISLAHCVNNIEALMLCDCGITCEGVEELARMIRALQTPMKKCALCWNTLSDENAESIVACSQNIAELDISDCGFTEAGKKFIQANTQGNIIT